MTLIAMAVYDTADNERTNMTRRTLESLGDTVNFDRHRLFVCDNGSCQETLDLYGYYQRHFPFTVLQMGHNRGTAVAINAAWKKRLPREHAIKMDNDVVIRHKDWVDVMEDTFFLDPTIGICGLKRKDVWESPEDPHPHGDYYRSELQMLPHEPGQRWLVVEEVNHVIGTCQAYNADLLTRIGFLYQMQDHGNLYGFDDSLAAYRSKVAGFRNVFLPWIEIDHIDPGGTAFTNWKHVQSGKFMELYHQVRDDYLSGKRPVYYAGP